MGVATSLESIHYSKEGRLAGNFMWSVAMIFSYERRIAETFSPTQNFLVMKRICSLLKVEFARSAIFYNLTYSH